MNKSVWLRKPLYMAVCATFLLSSCAISQQKIDQFGADYGMAIGCGAGALIGGALGYAIAGKDGVLGGGAVGMAAGCYAGHRWQKRMIALQEFANSQQVVLEVETVVKPLPESSTEQVKEDGSNLEQVGFSTQLNNAGMFDVSQSKLTPSGRVVLEKLVDTLLATPGEGMTDLSQRKFLVVGHTDSSGGAKLNQALSEARAREVGLILQARKVSPANIYFQGAGASRPIADNSSFTGRIKNRRVEIVELNGESALALRIAEEDRNLKYARFGTKADNNAEVELPVVAKPAAEQKVAEKKQTKKQTKKQAKVVETPASVPAAGPKAVSFAVDFAGRPVQAGAMPNLASALKPKPESFALIREAKASGLNLRSCAEDAPRVAGEVKNLASGAAFKPKAHTLDYIPGFSNSVWASPVNGNLVWLYPVSVLRDDFVVNSFPTLEVVPNYADGQRKPLPAVRSHAKVFEGDKEFLYRVYFEKGNAANASCMDLIFDRTHTGVKSGVMFYTSNTSELMVADYNPQRQAAR